MDAGAVAVNDASKAEAFAECIRQGVLCTFGAICGEEPVLSEEDGDEKPVDGIIGTISFVAERPWSLVLGIPRDTAVVLAPGFAGFEIDYDSNDMSDVVGELANILAGDLVARMDEAQIPAEMGLPSVARGDHMSLVLPDTTPVLHLYFSTTFGPMWCRVVVAKSHGHRNVCAHCGAPR